MAASAVQSGGSRALAAAPGLVELRRHAGGDKGRLAASRRVGGLFHHCLGASAQGRIQVGHGPGRHPARAACRARSDRCHGRHVRLAADAARDGARRPRRQAQQRRLAGRHLALARRDPARWLAQRQRQLLGRHHLAGCDQRAGSRGLTGMLEIFLSAFITLFVVLDPPGCAPIYAGLTSDASPQQKRSMAIRACVIAGAILLIFALFGERLLAALHIELDSFRTAGGIMLFLIALDMVFEKRTQRREARAEKLRESPEIEDVSVFPMAMPMLAGPGAIASIMLLSGAAEGIEEALVVLAALR